MRRNRVCEGVRPGFVGGAIVSPSLAGRLSLASRRRLNRALCHTPDSSGSRLKFRGAENTTHKTAAIVSPSPRAPACGLLHMPKHGTQNRQRPRGHEELRRLQVTAPLIDSDIGKEQSR